MFKKIFHYLKHFFLDLHDILEFPFAITCFDQMRRQFERMSEEDKARIRKKIDELE